MYDDRPEHASRPPAGAARHDAVILAGGTARRLGGVNKPALQVGTATLLERAVAAVPNASRVIVVGAEQAVAATATGGRPERLRWCREFPPGGGPVAATAAGLAHSDADLVLVLAADQPFLGDMVPRLLAAVCTAPDAGAAFLRDASDRVNYVAAAWRRTALLGALDRLPMAQDASMRALVDEISWVGVTGSPDAGLDCDTWDDVARARARADERDRHGPSGPSESGGPGEPVGSNVASGPTGKGGTRGA